MKKTKTKNKIRQEQRIKITKKVIIEKNKKEIRIRK